MFRGNILKSSFYISELTFHCKTEISSNIKYHYSYITGESAITCTESEAVRTVSSIKSNYAT